MNNDCTCKNCQESCKYKPGWFIPGEIEKVAEYLNISLQKLFDSKLGIDWHEIPNNIFIIAPAIKNMIAGEEYPANPKGECVFFESGRCTIHDVKPFECKDTSCNEDYEVSKKRHESIAEVWQDHEDQIIKLLGYEPEAEEYDLLSALWW